MAPRSRIRRIGFVGYERVTALDLVGASDVFSAANDLAVAAASEARPPYQILVLGLDRSPFRAESGLCFTPHLPLSEAPAIDTLIVPGGSGLREPAPLAQVSQWLRLHRHGFRRIASVCTGAYALAEAGLLDGCRATTHWRYAGAFARRYPDVQVDADAIFIQQDRIYTSAGITAGIDLALALVEEDHGPELALSVARELVVYLKRTGGQRQFSNRLALSMDADSRLAGLTAWIQDHEVPRAQHFDSLLGTPGVQGLYVPLMPYAYAALDALWNHLEAGAALPRDRRVQTEPPGAGQSLETTHLGFE